MTLRQNRIKSGTFLSKTALFAGVSFDSLQRHSLRKKNPAAFV